MNLVFSKIDPFQSQGKEKEDLWVDNIYFQWERLM